MVAYPYRPVQLPDETRLLSLQPGRFGDDLIGSLVHINIGSADSYDALSYCWSKSVTRPSTVNLDEPIRGVVISGGQFQMYDMPLRDAYDHPHAGDIYVRLGGPLPSQTITLDGVTVTVGGELARALRRMRTEDEPLRIWVDAVCIDQSNVHERNEHVKVMDRIYAGANLVRVWIGERTGVEESAIRALHEAAALLQDVLADDGKSRSRKSLQQLQMEMWSRPAAKCIEWDRLGDFLRRSWFERIWVVQEIVNAKRTIVHCGTFQFPWAVLGDVVHTLRSLKSDEVLGNPKAVTAVAMMTDFQRERNSAVQFSAAVPGESRLLYLLEDFRELESTIPSDKIYALLALADPNQRARVTIDYEKPSEQVFTEFAADEIRAGPLDVLTHCAWSPQPSPLHLPSWVPDWTRPGAVEPFSFRGLRCSAAGNTKAKILSLDEKGGTLELVGRILDKVCAVDDKALISWADGPTNALQLPIPATGHLAEALPVDRLSAELLDPESRGESQSDHAKSWMSKSVRNILTKIAFPNGTATDQQLEAAWRTFMCNRTRDNEVPSQELGPYWECLMLTMTGIGFRRLPPGSLADMEVVPPHELRKGVFTTMQLPVSPDKWEQEKYATFLGSYAKWCHQRRFFRSETGRYGWTVDGSQPGDLVAVFYGCNYPLVLRPVGDGVQSVRIIGDCYIDGLMDGEALAEGFPEHIFRVV